MLDGWAAECYCRLDSLFELSPAALYTLAVHRQTTSLLMGEVPVIDLIASCWELPGAHS